MVRQREEKPAEPPRPLDKDAEARARMQAATAARLAMAAKRDTARGDWARVTGSGARCDNPACRTGGRGSLECYRVAQSETLVDHSERLGSDGRVLHEVLQRNESFQELLCVPCKLRQLVQQHVIASLLDGVTLPPQRDLEELTGVRLDQGRYEQMRLIALRERQAPSEPVTTPALDRLKRREARRVEDATRSPAATGVL